MDWGLRCLGGHGFPDCPPYGDITAPVSGLSPAPCVALFLHRIILGPTSIITQILSAFPSLHPHRVREALPHSNKMAASVPSITSFLKSPFPKQEGRSC